MHMTLEKEVAHRAPAARLDSFHYDNAIVMRFAAATAIWGIVAFLVGIIVALKVVFPPSSFIAHTSGARWFTTFASAGCEAVFEFVLPMSR